MKNDDSESFLDSKMFKDIKEAHDKISEKYPYPLNEREWDFSFEVAGDSAERIAELNKWREEQNKRWPTEELKEEARKIREEKIEEYLKTLKE